MALPVKHVAAAVIASGNTVLAAQRADGDMKDGWELPGGKVEPGETPEQACRRECLEELGVKLGVLWEFGTVEHDYEDFHITMDVFVGTLTPGQTPEMVVHEDLRWLTRDDLLSVDWLPADRGLMTQIGMSWDEIFGDMHM